MRETPPAAPEPASAPAPAAPVPVAVAAPEAAPALGGGTQAAGRAGLAVGLGLLGGAVWLVLWSQKKQAELKQGEATYMPYVRDAAYAVGIPPWALAAIVQNESGWNISKSRSPTASAKCGVSCLAACEDCSSPCAIGLAQMKLATARDFGTVPNAEWLCNPANNLLLAARYLQRNYAEFGNWDEAFAAYHQGAGAWRAAKKKGLTPLEFDHRYVADASAGAEKYQGLAGPAPAPMAGPAFAAAPARRPQFRLFSPAPRTFRAAA